MTKTKMTLEQKYNNKRNFIYCELLFTTLCYRLFDKRTTLTKVKVYICEVKLIGVSQTRTKIRKIVSKRYEL